MAADFAPIFDSLKTVFLKHKKQLVVKADTPVQYTLLTKVASPFPQHKGQPMWFGEVRIGKAYVSLQLLPLYMNPLLQKKVSPALKKRMQGKACFNFKTVPEAELIADLKQLMDASVEAWREKKWI